MNLSWWNTLPSRMDGTLITLFSNDGLLNFGSVADGSGFPIRFYGLMYLAAFATCYQMLMYLVKKEKDSPLNTKDVENLLTWVVVGILLGGRLGYVFFYNFTYYMNNISEILIPIKHTASGWKFTGIAGMSYHGGLIGATLANIIYFRKYKRPVWKSLNFGFIIVPLGYTWGRIGNFLNSELYGRVTDSAIGMQFPTAPDPRLRHPSQLYEAFFEGVFLFAVMWFMRSKIPATRKYMLPIYIFGYGFVRYVIEYFREPDTHLGLNALALSRGQILCIAMMLVAVGLIIWGKLHEKKLES